MNKDILKKIRPLLFALGGAAVGLVYYRFFACANGCPITSSPVSTAVYMAVIGLLLSQLLTKEGEA